MTLRSARELWARAAPHSAPRCDDDPVRLSLSRARASGATAGRAPASALGARRQMGPWPRPACPVELGEDARAEKSRKGQGRMSRLKKKEGARADV